MVRGTTSPMLTNACRAPEDLNRAATALPTAIADGRSHGRTSNIASDQRGRRIGRLAKTPKTGSTNPAVDHRDPLLLLASLPSRRLSGLSTALKPEMGSA